MNHTQPSPFVDQAQAQQQTLDAAAILGNVKRSPFIGEATAEIAVTENIGHGSEHTDLPPHVKAAQEAERLAIIQAEAEKDEREAAEAEAYVTTPPAVESVRPEVKRVTRQKT